MEEDQCLGRLSAPRGGLLSLQSHTDFCHIHSFQAAFTEISYSLSLTPAKVTALGPTEPQTCTLEARDEPEEGRRLGAARHIAAVAGEL